MTRNRRVLFAAGVLFVLLFAAVSAHAAEESGNAALERATEIFKWINFAIVAGVIVWVFGKKLPPVFRKKAEAIRSAIANATNAKAAADAQLREAETRLANLQMPNANPPPKWCACAPPRTVMRRKSPPPQRLKSKLRNAPRGWS